MSSKHEIQKIDTIIKKTIDAIDKSRNEIFDIVEIAKKEKQKIEEEYENSKRELIELIENVKQIEKKLIDSKKKLLLSSKFFDQYPEEVKRKIYEETDNLRIELAVKRELEQYAVRKRNDSEFRLRDANIMVERAEGLFAAVGNAMKFLSGDLANVTSQIQDIQQRHEMGVKIIQAQEEERKRVAREIHDGPAQSMANVVLKAEICEKLLNVDLQATVEEIKNLKVVVKESLQDVRRIIYSLRPMSLDDLGLVPTLQRFINTFLEETKKDVLFRSKGDFSEIDSVISLTLFRIVQEGLNNAKKYSNANKITVNLEMVSGNQTQIVLSISDDGIGFDMEEAKKKHLNVSGGFGLFSMRERVELLNGSFEIVTAKNQGTRITAKIPITKE